MSNGLPTVTADVFKNALLSSTFEPVLGFSNISFRLEPLFDSLSVKYRNPISIKVNAVKDGEIIIAMELDNLVELCGHLPGAEAVIRSSPQGGALVVEYAGFQLWDWMSKLLGVHIQPISIAAGNTTQKTSVLHARLASDQGYDVPVSISCSCEETLKQLYTALIEKDPGVAQLGGDLSPEELITGRIYAGMMDAPRKIASEIAVGDVIDIVSNSSDGIEGILLMSDASAMPVRLFPNYAQIITEAPTLKISNSVGEHPDLSKIGAPISYDQIRLGFMFTRCSLTLKELRRASLEGGLTVHVLEDILLVGDGKVLAQGHLLDVDGLTQFVVDQVTSNA